MNLSTLGAMKRGRWGYSDHYRPNRKADIKYEAKRTLIGRLIVETHPELSWENFDHQKFLKIKKQYKDYLDTKTAKQLYLEGELQEVYDRLDYIFLLKVFPKLKRGKQLSDEDIKLIHSKIEVLVKLHKVRNRKVKSRKMSFFERMRGQRYGYKKDTKPSDEDFFKDFNKEETN